MVIAILYLLAGFRLSDADKGGRAHGKKIAAPANTDFAVFQDVSRRIDVRSPTKTGGIQDQARPPPRMKERQIRILDALL